MWDLLGSGIELVFRVLAGELLNTGAPGKPYFLLLMLDFSYLHYLGDGQGSFASRRTAESLSSGQDSSSLV